MCIRRSPWRRASTLSLCLVLAACGGGGYEPAPGGSPVPPPPAGPQVPFTAGPDDLQHAAGIELEGLEGFTFESAQYEALGELCRHLIERYPLHYVAGHEHIAPGRKQDPGPGFDWAKLSSELPVNILELPSQETPR